MDITINGSKFIIESLGQFDDENTKIKEIIMQYDITNTDGTITTYKENIYNVPFIDKIDN